MDKATNNKEGQKPRLDNGDEMKARILVIDDEAGIRDMLSCELGAQGHDVAAAACGEEAVEKMRRGKFSVAISDIKMPGMGGLEVLQALKKIDPDIEVIMTTGHGSVETAVDAMKQGAYDFIQKPFHLEEILSLVEKALEKNKLKSIVAVYETSKTISSSVKLDILLPKVTEFSLKILEANQVALILLRKSGQLELAAYSGFQDEKGRKAHLALGHRVLETAQQCSGPILVEGDLNADPRFSGIEGLQGIHSSIFFPLILGGQILGSLNVHRSAQDQSFDASHLRDLMIFGSQIAQAVYNAQLYQDLECKVQELQEAYQKLEHAQAQLIESDKMAAIGQLAAGVAHELNNPLTGIMGFAQLLLQSRDLTPSQREDMESIHQQSQRCRKIIQNLLQFSRRHEPKKENIHLISLLESTLDLVRYDFSTSGINIIKKLSRPIAPVYGDASQLQQVFLNLITNARQAMTGRSSVNLVIEARQVADHVIIKFKDNGCGISKKNLSKIFNPFFTTKPVGQGTGLGLSISYGILKAHQGTVQVESEEGKGSTFTVVLPTHHG